MSHILTLVIFLLVTSCSSSIANSPRRSSDISATIIENNDKLLAQNGFCETIGQSGNSFKRGKLEKQYITKEYRFTTIAEMRTFFCSFMENFLEPLNREKRIRPYLQNYPLTWKNINLTIAFFDEDDAPLTKPYFASVSNIDEHVYYEHYNPEDGDYITTAVEPMDRAFRIYHRQKG